MTVQEFFDKYNIDHRGLSMLQYRNVIFSGFSKVWSPTSLFRSWRQETNREGDLSLKIRPLFIRKNKTSQKISTQSNYECSKGYGSRSYRQESSQQPQIKSKSSFYSRKLTESEKTKQQNWIYRSSNRLWRKIFSADKSELQKNTFGYFQYYRGGLSS